MQDNGCWVGAAQQEGAAPDQDQGGQQADEIGDEMKGWAGWRGGCGREGRLFANGFVVGIGNALLHGWLLLSMEWANGQ